MRRLKKDIVKIIQPRMNEILTLVKKQLDEMGYLRLLGGGVVLTGGGSLIPGTIELAQDVFGLPARLGYPVKLGGLVEEYSSPIYATGIGLVLYGAQTKESRGYQNNKTPVSLRVTMNRIKSWLKEFF